MLPILNFETKKEYREYAKDLRSKLDIQKISFLICENIKNSVFYKKSKNILGFYPINSEIDLTELYKDDSKNWYLPSINISTKEMFIHPYKCDDILIENRYRVPEPVTPHETSLEKIDLIITPALMADEKGFRLGYGAGYYDRFLAKLGSSCIKAVPVPEDLFTDKLLSDEFDVPVNFVITEKSVNSIS